MRALRVDVVVQAQYLARWTRLVEGTVTRMGSGTDDAGNFGPFTTEQHKAMSAKNGIDETIVKRALLAAASDILADLEIEVNTETGVMSWPDPTIIPYGPRPVDPDRLISLAHAVMAGRKCWGVDTPTKT